MVALQMIPARIAPSPSGITCVAEADQKIFKQIEKNV
jgi:hypothetical protein